MDDNTLASTSKLVKITLKVHRSCRWGRKGGDGEDIELLLHYNYDYQKYNVYQLKIGLGILSLYGFVLHDGAALFR